MVASEQLSFEQIATHVRVEANVFSGTHEGLRLGSAFQPILSLEHRRVVGFEALLRPLTFDGAAMSPLHLFSSAKNEGESVFLDRLARLVHVKNFLRQQSGNCWLFLNIDPLVTVRGRSYGHFFEELLEREGIAPPGVVIEILEGQIRDESLLAAAVDYYRQLGCLIAIDDFGAGHSNFDRIWRICPHIVKLDRSIISQAAQSPKVRRVIPNLVGLIHEAGSLALMEGIENEDEALIAMDSGVDLVQGYHFARPAPALAYDCGSISSLFRKYHRSNAQKSCREREGLQPYRQAFALFAEKMRQGAAAELACEDFLLLPCAERCYLLDGSGRQAAANFLPPHKNAGHSPHFLPLMDASDAVWSRRHYFRRAVNSPGVIQVSRPYLSVAGGNLCVTLSVALDSDTVLCADLSWHD